MFVISNCINAAIMPMLSLSLRCFVPKYLSRASLVSWLLIMPSFFLRLITEIVHDALISDYRR